MADFRQEKLLWSRGYKKIAGLDEAGCGPLAGPVVAAAVIINKRYFYYLRSHIKDSKKLSLKNREKFYDEFTLCSQIDWAVGICSEKVIDKINIKNAAELAMERAVEKLKTPPDFLLIDGLYLKNKLLKSTEHKMVVKGDEKIFSCAVASILAKVTRDRIMDRYHSKYPKYRFDKHKGYPTKEHLKALKTYGPCVIHRRSFLPVKNLIK